MKVTLTLTIEVDEDEAESIMNSYDDDEGRFLIHETYLPTHPEWYEFIVVEDVKEEGS